MTAVYGSKSELTSVLNDALRRGRSDLARLRSTREGAVASTVWRQAVSSCAWYLYPHARLLRTPNGDVFVPLDTGALLCLTAAEGRAINASARLVGGTYIVSVDQSLVRSLFEITAGIWTDPRAFPEIGRGDALPPSMRNDAALPRGLEHVWAIVSRDFSVSRFGPVWDQPGWLKPGLAALCERRERARRLTFSSGLRFLLLHEVAHVCLGHTDLGTLPRPVQEVTWTAWRRAPLEITPEKLLENAFRRALEVSADRCAIELTFPRADRRLSVDVDGRLARVLGAVSVVLAFHALRVLSETRELASTHPPGWFRAAEIVDGYHALEAAPRDAVTAHRHHPRNAWLAQDPVRALGKLHSLYGEWFDPLSDRVFSDANERILQEARAALGPRREELTPHSKTIAPRAPDQPEIDEFVVDSASPTRTA